VCLRRMSTQVHAAVSKHIDLSVIKVVLVGSPGFVAADFCKHMYEAAVRNDERVGAVRARVCHHWWRLNVNLFLYGT